MKSDYNKRCFDSFTSSVSIFFPSSSSPESTSSLLSRSWLPELLKHKKDKTLILLSFNVQVALVICGLFICEFVYIRLKNGPFSGTYSLAYSHHWSFDMRIHYMRAYFWSPYLSHITRSTCTEFVKWQGFGPVFFNLLCLTAPLVFFNYLAVPLSV